ncbi:hypothetical protein EW145_g1928 [Phellinidium pouzarii]|uniref:Uncharacterized protein n=1 Tax=Phellinidium pouzarii TaxID=167371 RepID=A0A4S4LCS4_9AGAM|nr:hypothetical protein EW145_g1928 [Phellinidium pouzarii]
MAPNSNQRPSEAILPQPKKRKLATLGNFSFKKSNGSDARARLPSTPDMNVKRASKSANNGSIYRPSGSVTPGPSRMSTAPARPHPLAEGQTPIRPITVNQRLSTFKLAPSASRSRTLSPFIGTIPVGSVGAGSRMTPRGADARVHLRTPRLGAPVLKQNRGDTPAFGSEVTFVAVRDPPQGLRRARKTFDQTANKTVRRDTFTPVRRVSEDLIANENFFYPQNDEDDPYADTVPELFVQRAQADREDGVDFGTTATPDAYSTCVASGDNIPELMASLDALSLNRTGAALCASNRLPFLRRNLRRSLDALGSRGRALTSTAEFPKVRLVYSVGRQRFVGYNMHGWRCPLCRMLRNMTFATRAGLEIHLTRYHKHCTFSFVGDESTPLLHVMLPEVPDSDSESETDEEDELSSSESEKEMAPPLSPSPEFSTLRRSPTPEQKPFLRGSSVVGGRHIFAPSPFKRDSSPPTPFTGSSRASLGRQFIPGYSPTPGDVKRPARPIDPADPERYPTPPPFADLEGPAAVPPYLTDGMHSARPGGPRLYDLLNELPLTPFGLMSWYVLDKEEDIFELDNVRDEDKVMRALWGRWILLNRNTFIADYERGVRMFIDEYWRMIHRAAGFSALRIWLLTLTQNRYGSVEMKYTCYSFT